MWQFLSFKVSRKKAKVQSPLAKNPMVTRWRNFCSSSSQLEELRTCSSTSVISCSAVRLYWATESGCARVASNAVPGGTASTLGFHYSIYATYG